MKTKAVAVPDAITIVMAGWTEGQLVLETDCTDFDTYKALPAAVIYQGMECAKTGWSSDTHRACYKSGTSLIARAKIDVYAHGGPPEGSQLFRTG